MWIAFGPQKFAVADVGHQPGNGQHLDLKHGAGAFRRRIRLLRVAGCVPANRAPKGANPEKMVDAREALRLCPPHTPKARVEPGAGGHREGCGESARYGGGAKRAVAHMFHQPIAFMPQNRKKCLA